MMHAPATSPRPFTPGTTGWTADDLDDAEIDRRWEQGRYEIVEGVLAVMPAAYFDGGVALGNLVWIIKKYLEAANLDWKFAPEADVIFSRTRVTCADAVFLTPEDVARQRAAHAERSRRRGHARQRDLRFGRILIPPTLIIESVSLGHEVHDRETKRAWYAEGGVANYWVLDAQRQALECWVLDKGEGRAEYRVDQAGEGKAELRPTLFPGLIIPLAGVWLE